MAAYNLLMHSLIPQFPLYLSISGEAASSARSSKKQVCDVHALLKPTGGKKSTVMVCQCSIEEGNVVAPLAGSRFLPIKKLVTMIPPVRYNKQKNYNSPQ